MRVVKWVAVVMLFLLAGCSNRQAAESAAGGVASPAAFAPQSKAGAFLAYEHSATIKLGKQQIAARLAAAQAGCLAQTFGDCVVLDVEQHGGEFPGGKLSVRIVPNGVEPMIGAAGQGGDVSDRSTRAEDLAEAVQATTVQGDRLVREHAKLLEFEARPNLSVADMLVLSKQLADVESQLDATQQDSAQQQRRIKTNLLTITFQLPTGATASSEIGQAFRDFGQILATATAFVIRAVAALIPLFFLFVVVLLLWRWRRRAVRTANV